MQESEELLQAVYLLDSNIRISQWWLALHFLLKEGSY
jgi:hypothetical protein